MKTLVGCVLGFVLFMLLLFSLFSVPPAREDNAYSEFMAALDGGQIDAVTVRGLRLTGQLKDGHRLATSIPPSQALLSVTDRLLAKNVKITVLADDGSASAILAGWVPLLLCYALFFGGVWFLMTRPIIALIRQLDTYIALQRTASGPNPPGEQNKP